ncbi:5-oxopent-3-ene-1,2,5-tricarboxylate decarboxylase [Sphingomonas sp. So64.6b]|nr:5-oxopent-3-ene-1,2,5-tricarboxylate decarboxylase [Sphingomonas sp. So64.6b]
MISGTVYGVVLNDQSERAALSGAFLEAPYRAPPEAPVLYIKPRNTISASDSIVAVPADIAEVTVAATLALAIGDRGQPVAARLAIDVSEPHDCYFRPAIRERCRDGFLPLGPEGALPNPTEQIVTLIDGHEVHRWSLDRLVSPMPELLHDIGCFMSLLPGDILLIGLAGDAPKARPGQTVTVQCGDRLPLVAHIGVEKEA